MQVFAIIGLHTMGDIVMDAPNFNTFYESFLSVFQVLTPLPCHMHNEDSLHAYT